MKKTLEIGLTFEKTLEINKCKKHWKLINEITLEINFFD